MRRKVKDEFTHLPISRQRKYQLRKLRDRRGVVCGESPVTGSRCLRHLIEAREAARKRLGLKKRYKWTPSYVAEAAKGTSSNRAQRSA
jgi:hypothetical protein